MLASIIICTYNRSELLEASLRSVVNQDLPADVFEVIVVDNNSSDNTQDKVMAISSSSQVKISYIFEEKQGLSYARNAGIEASSGKIVAFTDDDIEADREWLPNLLEAFDPPEVSCAGGPLKPLWPHPRPEWLADALLPAIAISDFPTARMGGEFKGPDYPWGANIAFRKSVFASIGMFPTDLGRVGNKLLSNEEIFLCKRIEQSNQRIAFAEKAIIYHKVAASRLRKSYFLHRYSNQGASDAILDVVTGSNPYRRLQQLILSLKSSHLPPFVDRCFLRSAAGYLYQLASLGESGTVQLNTLRLFHSALAAIADTSATRLLLNELQERNAWALKLDEAVTARDDTVRSLQVTVDERTAWALNLKNELEQRDLTVQSLQQEIDDRTVWALGLKEDLVQRDLTIQSLQKEVTEQKGWALTLKNRLDEELKLRREELAEISKKFESKKVLKKTLQEQLLRKDQELQKLQERYEAEREQLKLELLTKELLINSILKSMSWKITFPLRVIYSAFTKKRQN